MIFLSPWFLIFIAIIALLYWTIPLLDNWITPQKWIKQGLILIASCCFYWHCGGGLIGILPVLILGAITYGCGVTQQKRWCIAGVVACVVTLVFYKYTLFLSQSLVSLIPGLNAASILSTVIPTTPPLGISFFVFEFIHYLVDVMRGSPAIAHPFQFAQFGLFFPTLVAGPIKRYEQFVPQIEKLSPRIAKADILYGSIRIAVGLLKKIVADNLTIYLAFWSDHFDWLTTEWRWVALGFMALRIYLDFSGYSDMAIGYARWFGIKIPENFNFPYIATNIREFWQRWHISLSNWIRDYIYIPLGGNRHGISRKILNALIAFTLCGLWHGAGWNFALWGLYHGVGLAISSNYKAALGGLGQGIHAGLNRLPLLCWAITLLYVCFGWLLFFYPLPQAWRMAQLLVGAT